MDRFKQILLQFAYMLTGNRWRVAILTIVADVWLLLGGHEIPDEKAELIAKLVTLVGSLIIAALTMRDPTSGGKGKGVAAAAFLLVFLLPACATAQVDAAYRFAQVQKLGVDTAAGVVEAHVRERVAACEHLRGEGAALVKCMGPIASRPDEVEAAAEAVRVAQVALYLVLIRDDLEPQQLALAVAELRRAVAAFGRLAEKARLSP